MTANEAYEQKIPRDAEYFLLIALSYWLKMEKIKKRDREILDRKTEVAVTQWLTMNRTEKIIFLNRVLYEYWTKANTRFGTFFAYRDFIRGKAEEIRQKQQRSSRSKDNNTGSAGKTHHHMDSRLAMACKVLGLSLNADQQQIKKAYRELAKRHHPDHGGEEQLFIKVQAAYEFLSKKAVSY